MRIFLIVAQLLLVGDERYVEYALLLYGRLASALGFCEHIRHRVVLTCSAHRRTVSDRKIIRNTFEADANLIASVVLRLEAEQLVGVSLLHLPLQRWFRSAVARHVESLA